MGVTDPAYDGPYVIQPMTSPQPFLAYCYFSPWSGKTLALWRPTLGIPANCAISWSNRGWADYAAGFGSAASKNFFIGLKNLRLLTSQAKYTLTIFHFHTNHNKQARALYSDFSLSAATYDFTFTSFASDPAQPADDGMAAASPRSFCASDRCVSGCYATRSAPGWFGPAPDCQGYSDLDLVMTWPITGEDEACDEAVYTLERVGGF
ncbi:microfibril-associated glycoprotein 4-like [Littorina saxatilis]|uniref:Fibrinogen C-terminal domain-containing protein n=1 Tax=Littorina saxatilis TaxID=31220 RepID=A0AAN9AWT9_9CAEN